MGSGKLLYSTESSARSSVITWRAKMQGVGGGMHVYIEQIHLAVQQRPHSIVKQVYSNKKKDARGS